MRAVWKNQGSNAASSMTIRATPRDRVIRQARRAAATASAMPANADGSRVSVGVNGPSSVSGASRYVLIGPL